MLPDLLRWGHLRLATYGVCVAGAYLLGIWWLRGRREAMGLDEKRFWALVYCVFLGALAGGKLFYVLVEWDRFASGQLGFFRDFRFGFVFYGGFLGAALMGFAYGRWAGIPRLPTADYFAAALPMGQAVGRLGCFAAGCCHGRPTELPWGVRFTRPDSLVPEELLGVPLHPAQLYEALGTLLLFPLLLRALRRVREGALRPGAVFYGYILAYAVLRLAVEAFRGDDRGGFQPGLSPSQLIAAACIVAAAALLWRNGLWTKRSA